jgi:hypothetical protein
LQRLEGRAVSDNLHNLPTSRFTSSRPALRPALLADRITRRRSRSKTLVKFVKDVPHYETHPGGSGCSAREGGLASQLGKQCITQRSGTGEK